MGKGTVTVLVALLIAGTKISSTKVIGGEGYINSQCVEVSVHIQLASKKGSTAKGHTEEKQSMA